jgi:hypothetical protein
MNGVTCQGCTTTAADAATITDGIGRRTFLVQSALMAAAAALAACGGADATAPTLSAGTSINVNTYAALANVGGIAMVTVSGAQLAVPDRRDDVRRPLAHLSTRAAR